MCTSFFHKLDKYNPNIDLHAIFLVEINKCNLKIWAIMTYSVIFLTLKSVIYGHYVLRTDFGHSYHKCCCPDNQRSRPFLNQCHSLKYKIAETCSLIFYYSNMLDAKYVIYGHYLKQCSFKLMKTLLEKTIHW